MKILRNILANPSAIAFAAVHWIVVVFAIYGENHSQSFHFYNESLLIQWLYLLNFLPLIFAGMILEPVLAIFGQNSFTLNFGLFLNFLTITFQWLVVGYLIAEFIASIRRKS